MTHKYPTEDKTDHVKETYCTFVSRFGRVFLLENPQAK